MDLGHMLKRIDDMRDDIGKRRPLTEKEALQLRNFYRVGLTYTSNALEGNSLTLTVPIVFANASFPMIHLPMKEYWEFSVPSNNQ